MTKKLYPCDYDWEPIPPGDTILELLEYYGLSQKELAERTGYSLKHINQVILGHAPLTAELAVVLERVLTTSAQTWNRLEAQYQTRQVDRQAKERLQAEKAILRHPVIRELKKRGKIVCGEPAEEVDAVLRFFQVGTIEALRKISEVPIQAALRHCPSFQSDPLALTAWLRLGERAALEMECRPFNKTRFRENLDTIRTLTVKKPEEFVPELVRLCADAGVSVVFVPEIKGTCVSGATKWFKPDKAMMILNLRGKKNDVFWFTFFHEAAHILFGGKREFIVEMPEKNGGGASEQRADAFASKMLIRNALPPLDTESAIRAFAAENGIAPGIVVGRLQSEKVIPANRFNHLKETVGW